MSKHSTIAQSPAIYAPLIPIATALACGCGLYYGLIEGLLAGRLTGNVDYIGFYGALTAIAIFLLALSVRFKQPALLWLTIMLAGLSYSQWRDVNNTTQLLQRETQARIMGQVQGIERKYRGYKMRIKARELRNIRGEQITILGELRISSRRKLMPRVGDIVRLQAKLFPPSPALFPAGYDFARSNRNHGIAAIGYVSGYLEIVEQAKTTPLQQLRQHIANLLQQNLSKSASGLAMALLLGDKNALPDELREAMQQAGLAHIMAVSGMHMGLLAMLVFFAVRYAIACWPALALPHDSNKTAALVALLCCGLYLLLTGMPISATRAYIMLCCVLLAILCSRAAQSINGLALAGIIILLWQPYALLEIGFQLSFAATYGLLLFYQHYGQYWQRLPDWLKLLTASMLPTFISSLATLPYVLYHFNLLANYSLLANLLAIPLLSFYVMPLLVAAVLVSFWPWLAQWLLWLAGYGLQLMLQIGQFTTSLAGAVTPVAQISSLSVILFTGVLLCLLRRELFPCAAALLLLALNAMPQPMPMLLANRENIAVLWQGQPLLLQGEKDSFSAQIWQTKWGSDYLALDKLSPELPAEIYYCNQQACTMQLGKQRYILVRQDLALLDVCWQDKAIILLRYGNRQLRENLRHNCAATVKILPRRGVLAIYE
jgi:competence protein ComEC